MRIGYHATDHLPEIISCGKVVPRRMGYVYLFKDELSAIEYAKEFKYKSVVAVEYDPSDVVSTWKPKWNNGKSVVRLGYGKTARFISEIKSNSM